eukprot:COSAG05_NODE_1946_length_3797_cov_2.430233_5_plen_122_part_00
MCMLRPSSARTHARTQRAFAELAEGVSQGMAAMAPPQEREELRHMVGYTLGLSLGAAHLTILADDGNTQQGVRFEFLGNGPQETRAWFEALWACGSDGGGDDGGGGGGGGGGGTGAEKGEL